MKYKKLPNFNKKISTIGIGTWSLANEQKKNYFYKKISKKTIYKILNSSFDRGINFYDTSPAYGKSEKFLGKIFKKKRDKLIFSTKIGLSKFGDKIDFSQKKVEKQIYYSLKNLQTDHLDFLLFYNPNKINYSFLKSYEFLQNLRLKGVIRKIGVSLKSPLDLSNLIGKVDFEVVQCNFNILDHRIYEKKIMNIILKKKIIIIARTILGLGFFTEMNYEK